MAHADTESAPESSRRTLLPTITVGKLLLQLLLLQVSAIQLVAADYNQSSSLLQSVSADISNRCCISTVPQADIAACVEGVLTAGLGECFKEDASGIAEAIVILVPDFFIPGDLLESWASGFFNQTAIKVTFNVVEYGTYLFEVIAEAQRNVSETNSAGWLLVPLVIPTMADMGALLDLGPLIKQDSSLGWTQFLPFLRDYWSVFDQHIKSIPLDGNTLAMYYRMDVLDAANISVPATWSDFVQLARQLNGTLDLDGDGVLDYSLCLETARECQAMITTTAIAAPMLQYKGLSQGLFIDPDSMQPLLNSTAVAQAMKWLEELASYSEPSSRGCDASANALAEGRCALALGFVQGFKASQLSPKSKVRNVLGVAPLPGSTYVLDRATERMVECTEALCPYATRSILYDGSNALVNRAPYSVPGAFQGSVSNLVPAEQQRAAYKFFSYLASSEVSFNTVAGANTSFGPYRMEHMKSVSWASRGYDAADSSRYLETLQAIISAENVVMDVRIPGAVMTWIKSLYAIDAYLDGSATLDTSLGTLQSAWANVIAADFDGTSSFYRKSIGWQAAPVTSGQQLVGSGAMATERASGLNIVRVVVPSVVGGLVVVLACLWLLLWRRRDARWTLTGQVVAPGAGPDTTLVVTDIQDSTSLWEAFNFDFVMDKAIKQHHLLIRQLLVRFGGYESATEGDSFILTFHSPKDAVLFALQLQQQLLTLPWPQELLQHPVCAVVLAASHEFAQVSNVEEKARLGGASSRDLASYKTLAVGDTAADGCIYDSEQQVHAKTTPASCVSYRHLLMDAHKLLQHADEAPEGSVLIFRGLRVRVGIHAGLLDQAAVSFNDLVQRTQYTGDALVLAKAVGDAAQGAMVLLSGATYRLLPMEELGRHARLLHCGCHVLKGVPDALDIYQIAPKALAARVPHFGALRTLRPLEMGVLEAPAGAVSVVFLYVVGAQSLLAWNSEVARASISMLHELSRAQLAQHGGYMVEQTGDLVLAAFQRCAAAALATLTTIKEGLMLLWPQELLEHPLCEELTLMPTAVEHSAMSLTSTVCLAEPLQRQAHVLLRGLRLKAGIDTGRVVAGCSCTTGRVTYRGRVMNRAARIASTASSGQVLLSEASFHEVVSDPEGAGLTLTPVGKFNLKGINATVPLYQAVLCTNINTGTGDFIMGRTTSSDSRLGGPPRLYMRPSFQNLDEELEGGDDWPINMPLGTEPAEPALLQCQARSFARTQRRVPERFFSHDAAILRLETAQNSPSESTPSCCNQEQPF